MKKLLSLILTLAMLCTMYVMFSTTASAEGAPSGDFVTFSSAEEFTIFALKMWDGKLYYSADGTSWAEYAGSTALTAAQIGGTGNYYLCFRGENNSVMSDGSPLSYWRINGSGVSCNGSIENLRDYTGSIPMGEYCYNGMFFNCTSLVTAPSLPATNLSDHCYETMFYGCTSLVEAPTLPAENLAFACYSYMFSGCTSIVTAPSLPATTLAEYCYQYMFYGCTGIKLYENAAAVGGASTEWAIPAAANGEGLRYWNSNMFSGTGGDFTGAPDIGKTYFYPTLPVECESHNVTGSYQAGAAADTVYSVEIAWGSMEFTYTSASEGTWNPATHAYDGAAAGAWSCITDANKITVTNHSNTAVDATLSYTAEATYSAISGAFTEASGAAINDNKLELATAAGTDALNAPTASATFNLAGALASGLTSTKIGSVTVTIN